MRLITETLAAEIDHEQKSDDIIPSLDISPRAFNLLYAQRAGFRVNCRTGLPGKNY